MPAPGGFHDETFVNGPHCNFLSLRSYTGSRLRRADGRGSSSGCSDPRCRYHRRKMSARQLQGHLRVKDLQWENSTAPRLPGAPPIKTADLDRSTTEVTSEKGRAAEAGARAASATKAVEDRWRKLHSSSSEKGQQRAGSRAAAPPDSAMEFFTSPVLTVAATAEKVASGPEPVATFASQHG
jgi:hypothetical protein